MIVDLIKKVQVALSTVPDPEIPTCSVLDLGLLESIEETADGVKVSLVPTFIGCPALEVIWSDTVQALELALPGAEVEVVWLNEPEWTTDRITPEGREGMRSLGIAPPGQGVVVLDIVSSNEEATRCPYCDAHSTRNVNQYGPTPCRTVAECLSCEFTFERFKQKDAD